MKPSLRATLLCLTGAAALAGPPALAQEKFPSKPIEVVTHAGVGGGTDITARMMMVQAPAELGTEFVVVNKTGGSGAAALAYAASRPKDGHTILLMTQTHVMTILQGRASGLKLDDIVALARATEDPQIVMVGKGSPFKTAREFIDASKAKSMKYGTTQVASIDHIAVLSFAKDAGLQTPNVVPFRGGGDVVINLVGGNLDAAVVNLAEAESQIKAGEVRALLVLAADRIPSLPDVPTATELGAATNQSTVRGFAVLKGTPPDRIKALEEGLLKAMNGKIFQDYLRNSGQSLKSVVGQAEWQAQIEGFARDAHGHLVALGLIK